MKTFHNRRRMATWALVAAALTNLFMAACQRPPQVPGQYTATQERPLMFPDYTDITCPYNIAPLNFKIMNPGKTCVAELDGQHGSLTAESDGEGKIRFTPEEWKSLLEKHKGDSLTARLYVKDGKGWRMLRPYMLHIAAEPIDSFLTYRLIEPGYVAYKSMGIYQRDLTTFEVKTVYETQENRCVNCHNYQGQDTRRMMLHVRGHQGGTVVCDNGRTEKVRFPTETPYGATYPAWHPARPWLVFSSNKTYQAFHVSHPEKVEVQDIASDLIFYDHAHRSVRHILQTDSVLETFPHWSPDGRRLYFTAAHVPAMGHLSPEDQAAYAMEHYRELRYDILYMDFNDSTQTFGSPHTLVFCSTSGKSASQVRVSPDGRYLLYTLAGYGQFHIWHKDADLWVCDLREARPVPRPLAAANSKEADSFHSWSSNGRWIAFSTRRDDGNYTRAYLAYFDRNGLAHKAFMLPQEDPDYHFRLLKSFNVPELSRNAVSLSREEMEKAVNGTQTGEIVFDPAHAR
mgnify:CR=1 FL=1